MNIAKFLGTVFFTEHLRWLLLDLFLACGSSRLDVFCKKEVLRNFAKFTGKHKKEKKETLAHWFSCKFRKIYKNSFSYRLPPVAASAHVIPHSLPILSHPPSISNRVPPLPFSSRRHYKMNTQNLHLLDISIASNPANIVTFYKKNTRWTATSKKFIFKCESLSYLLNFLS